MKTEEIMANQFPMVDVFTMVWSNFSKSNESCKTRCAHRREILSCNIYNTTYILSVSTTGQNTAINVYLESLTQK